MVTTDLNREGVSVEICDALVVESSSSEGGSC